MKSRITIALFIVAICSFSVTAQVAQTKRFAIDIAVDTSKDLESDVNSYLARELRSLGDVDVSESADLLLGVRVIKINMKGKDAIGYAVSYHTTEVVTCGNNVFTNLVDLGGMMITNSEGLRRAMEQIVTELDQSLFEKRRKRSKS